MRPYYQKGDVTLWLGDAREILPGLEAGSVDAVVTDPPWKASNGSRVLRRAGDGFGVAPCRSSTSLAYGSIGVFDLEVVRLCFRASRADVCILCGYMELPEVLSAAPKLRGVFVWHNPRATPIPGPVGKRDVAFIVWGGERTQVNGEKRWASSLFVHDSPAAGCMATERILNGDGSTAHPAQEPLALFERIVEPLGETILDPYIGTGTTGVAAVRLGRKFIGIEINEAYAEIAARRIEAAQGAVQMSLPLAGRGTTTP